MKKIILSLLIFISSCAILDSQVQKRSPANGELARENQLNFALLSTKKAPKKLTYNDNYLPFATDFQNSLFQLVSTDFDINSSKINKNYTYLLRTSNCDRLPNFSNQDLYDSRDEKMIGKISFDNQSCVLMIQLDSRFIGLTSPFLLEQRGQ